MELARSKPKNRDEKWEKMLLGCGALSLSWLPILADGSLCSSASMEYNIGAHSSDVDMHIVHWHLVR